MDNLQVGAVGWLHADWQGTFYPDDMPQEWQLDYYGNAFHVVLVPQSQWLEWRDEELEDYADNVEEDFAFYLELKEPVDQHRLQQLLLVKQVLGSFLCGVVVFSESWLPERSLEGVPVSLVSKSLQLPGWHWEVEGSILSGAPFGYVENLQEDGKWQTALLQDFVGSFPPGLLGAPFFIGGDSIDMAQVTNLKVIGELLGY